jgi:hypothetical protein
VDISCVNVASMSDGGGGSLSVLSVHIRQGTAGAFGSGTTCMGLGVPVMTYKLKNNTSQNDFFVGAALNTSSGVNSPTSSYIFNTASTGGVPIVVQAVYTTP